MEEESAMALLAELGGWLGALVVLAGYAALSLGWISNGRLFQGCNLTGSVALMVNGYYHGAWPFVALNVAWGTISAVALIRALKANRPRSSHPSQAQDSPVNSQVCED
ncbi:hypothetical protein [Arthrobacter sp. ISL-30]|uniref:CBU_0592 family membrane protein n=1 Tax=Arthrobacter sp. ISL-30 TaxID=2819109 RepID=UPI001BEC3E28|nr:hypothetical protein [Arthrobacter sp. ISL-30]MBT2515686.1 hypothetical protein [Arthrobacter sp. ISL-30]